MNAFSEKSLRRVATAPPSPPGRQNARTPILAGAQTDDAPGVNGPPVQPTSPEQAYPGGGVPESVPRKGLKAAGNPRFVENTPETVRTRESELLHPTPAQAATGF